VALTLDFAFLEAVALASVRIIAFLVIAPPFSHNAFPLRVKGMLALGIAVAVGPGVARGYVSPDTGGFILSLLENLAIGALLGFLVMVVFSAVQSAGNLIDLFGGFQLAQAFDPQSMINGAQFARLFNITAIALLFATGGYQLIIGGIAKSFTALPIGEGVQLAAPVHALTDAVGQMLVAALQIAGPLIVVLFLADAGLGLVTRVAPALNAFALGFPLKILITLTLVSVVFVALPRIVESLTGDSIAGVLGVN
jgi:flagellar biosynthetic protein FliR